MIVWHMKVRHFWCRVYPSTFSIRVCDWEWHQKMQVNFPREVFSSNLFLIFTLLMFWSKNLIDTPVKCLGYRTVWSNLIFTSISTMWWKHCGFFFQHFMRQLYCSRVLVILRSQVCRYCSTFNLFPKYQGTPCSAICLNRCCIFAVHDPNASKMLSVANVVDCLGGRGLAGPRASPLQSWGL